MSKPLFYSFMSKPKRVAKNQENIMEIFVMAIPTLDQTEQRGPSKSSLCQRLDPRLNLTNLLTTFRPSFP